MATVVSAAEAQRNKELLRLLRTSLTQTIAALRSTSHHNGAEGGGDAILESLEVARLALAAAAGETSSDSAPPAAAATTTATTATTEVAAEAAATAEVKQEDKEEGAGCEAAMEISEAAPSSLSDDKPQQPSPQALLAAVNQELSAFTEQCLQAQALAKQKLEARKKTKQENDKDKSSSSSSSSAGGGGGGKINSDGTWSCSSCTFSNKASARRCEVCFTYRPAAAGAEVRKEEKAAAAAARRASEARKKKKSKRARRRKRKEAKGSDAGSSGGGSDESGSENSDSGSGDSDDSDDSDDDSDDDSGSDSGSGSESSSNESDKEQQHQQQQQQKQRQAPKSKEKAKPKEKEREKAPATARKSVANGSSSSSSSSSKAKASASSSTSKAGKSSDGPPKFSSPAASPRPQGASGINRKRSFDEFGGKADGGDTPSARGGGGGGSGSGSRLWLGGRNTPATGAGAGAGAGGDGADGDDNLEGTMLVWTCSLCTLENSMRARQCGACGESRAHSIRGFDGADGTPRQAPKRVKIQEPSSNPRKFPAIGPSFQLDLGSLPEAGPWDAARAKREHGIDGDEDSQFWTSVWIAPRTSKGLLLEDCPPEELASLSPSERALHALLCAPRVSFVHEKLPSQMVPLPNCVGAAAAGAEQGDDAGEPDAEDNEQDRERDKRASEKIQAATTAVLQARSDDEKRHNAIDEFLAAHPAHHSRALETLWKLDYDLDTAAAAMEQVAYEAKEAAAAAAATAAAAMAAGGDVKQLKRKQKQDEVEAGYALDRQIPLLDEEERAKMVEALGRHGEEWAKVKVSFALCPDRSSFSPSLLSRHPFFSPDLSPAHPSHLLTRVQAYMGHSHDVGQLQDYFYAVMCTASHAALRAEANRRHKALLRAKEKQEQAEKRKRSLEEARARAEALRAKEAEAAEAGAGSAAGPDIAAGPGTESAATAVPADGEEGQGAGGADAAATGAGAGANEDK